MRAIAGASDVQARQPQTAAATPFSSRSLAYVSFLLRSNMRPTESCGQGQAAGKGVQSAGRHLSSVSYLQSTSLPANHPCTPPSPVLPPSPHLGSAHQHAVAQVEHMATLARLGQAVAHRCLNGRLAAKQHHWVHVALKAEVKAEGGSAGVEDRAGWWWSAAAALVACGTCTC